MPLPRSHPRVTEKRFRSIWRRWQRRTNHGPNPSSIFEELRRCYGEPHRRYHTLEHIEHCLAELDLAAHLLPDPDAVEMAIWFHDAVYAPQRSDNEWRSAQFFARAARGELEPSFTTEVCELILATAHGALLKRFEERLVVDIDLSSFGHEWHRFRRDTFGLRQECAARGEGEFRKAQLRFDRALLARPSFFRTVYFRERYERTARYNVGRRLRETEKAMGMGESALNSLPLPSFG